MSKKNSNTAHPEFREELVTRLLNSSKYRYLALPPQTIFDLIDKALQTRSDPRAVEDIVRHKLHNLVAPYLGDPDYARLQNDLISLPADLESPEIKDFCLRVLNAHSSTRERIPIQEDFYRQLFASTSIPGTILDLACGLNPFALPWMHLPKGARYFAYDLHQPRVALINAFLAHVGQVGSALHQDILVAPPAEPADVVFFFKEAHRFEQREHGSNAAFLQALPAKIILLSLPTASLTGRHSKLDQDRRLVASAIAGQPWQLTELLFESEIVFCIRKSL